MSKFSNSVMSETSLPTNFRHSSLSLWIRSKTGQSFNALSANKKTRSFPYCSKSTSSSLKSPIRHRTSERAARARKSLSRCSLRNDATLTRSSWRWAMRQDAKKVWKQMWNGTRCGLKVSCKTQMKFLFRSSKAHRQHAAVRLTSISPCQQLCSLVECGWKRFATREREAQAVHSGLRDAD